VHKCYLHEDTRLPMMYIDDCLRALYEMMVAPPDKLSCRTYNVHAMSFTPKELYEAVKKRVPELEIVYKVDGRQKIGKWIPSVTKLLETKYRSAINLRELSSSSRHLATGL
jgi:threonine 3-dehydrogenase